MPLNPQLAAVLAQAREGGAVPLYALAPAEARQASARARAAIGPGPGQFGVEDLSIPVGDDTILGRRYRPIPSPEATIVWFHGGGWVLGSVDGSDATMRHLACASGCEIISIDYRLAPEHPFPVPVEDAWSALQWVAAQAPAQPLVVGGESAGGNLATVCARRARDAGGPALTQQVLVYPVTDHDLSRDSYVEHGDRNYPLGIGEMRWFWDLYLPDETMRSHPDASPLRCPDLSGLPPALVMIAEFDPLRDEIIAYAERLEDAGVRVTILRVDDMTHGCFGMVNVLTRSDEIVKWIGCSVAEAIRSPQRR
jgi:acetyl esterase